MQLYDILVEKKKEKKKELFVNKDENVPFPDDTVKGIEKDINKLSKDMKKNWKSAKELVDTAFEENKVPIPMAFMKSRWEQYVNLLSVAIKNLKDARGFDNEWSVY